MKRAFLICSLITVLVTALACPAMQLEPGSLSLITNDPCQCLVQGYGTFTLSGDKIGWTDVRDFGSHIYGTLFSDPEHNEKRLYSDPNYYGFYNIYSSGDWAVFGAYRADDYSSNLMLMHTDDMGNASVYPLASASDKSTSYSISGRLLAARGSDPTSYNPAIYAIDIAEPCDPPQYKIYSCGPNETVESLIASDNLICWTGYVNNWPDEYYSFFALADVTDPCNPVIHKTRFPDEFYFYDFKVSGDWLVARGSVDDFYGIFAVKNFTSPDPNNWQIVKVGQGEIVSGPEIDGNIVLWVQGNSGHPQVSAQSEYQESGGLYGAYLNDGFAVVSPIYSVEDPEYIDEVRISGHNLVWSQGTYDPQPDEPANILVGAKIQLTCGDYGFKPADLNHDCRVNLKDFALFALDWLTCSDPQGCN